MAEGTKQSALIFAAALLHPPQAQLVRIATMASLKSTGTFTWPCRRLALPKSANTDGECAAPLPLFARGSLRSDAIYAWHMARLWQGGKLVIDGCAHYAQSDELWRTAQAVASWGHRSRGTHSGKGCRFYRMVNDAKHSARLFIEAIWAHMPCLHAVHTPTVPIELISPGNCIGSSSTVAGWARESMGEGRW